MSGRNGRRSKKRKMEKIKCKCGCGIEFTKRSSTHLYYDRSHLKKYYRETAKTQTTQRRCTYKIGDNGRSCGAPVAKNCYFLCDSHFRIAECGATPSVSIPKVTVYKNRV